jgi:hypothetical protein
LALPPAGAASVKPDHLACDDTKSYSISSYTYNNLVQTIPTVQYLNKSAVIVTLTTQLGITGTVSGSFSVTAGVEEGIVLASVKTSVTAQATLTLTLSGSWTTSASMPVRPGKVGYIQGGIFRVKTSGTYRHTDVICNTFTTAETAYMPYNYGWIASGG